MQERILYLGMPGSGKTTTLLKLLEDELKTTAPGKIAYVSFTKKAIHEAQERAFKQLDVKKKDMPFFKTLHALAFSALSLTKSDVVKEEHLKNLGSQLGIDLLDKHNPFQPLSLYNLSRVKGVSFYKIWETTYLIHTKTYNELLHIITAYRAFKKREQLYDFTDMILHYNKYGASLPVKVAFVDEAQDLSTVQWKMIEKAFAGADKLILAGDDDQCIYSWSGADKKLFLNFHGEKRILDTSYRCPAVVANFANEISGKIKRRYIKELQGTSEVGAVKYLSGIADNTALLNNGEQWMILVRNRVDINIIRRQLIAARLAFSVDGKNYSPHKHLDAIEGLQKLNLGQRVSGATAQNIADCAGLINLYFENEHTYDKNQVFKNTCNLDDFRRILLAIYLPRLLYYYDSANNKQDLKNPKIQLLTIHGSKGAECENVILSCDQSVLTFKSMQRFPDNEHRVFYVGATRAKKNLYLLQVTKKRHYKMSRSF